MEVDPHSADRLESGFCELALARPCEEWNHLSRSAAVARLFHQCGLCVVDDFHHLLGPALTPKATGQIGMRLSQDDHQSGNQPSGDDANLFDETLFNPEEQLIGFLQQTPRRHHSPPPPMPAEVTLLLLDRLLEHGLQSTISAG